jgi:hypothetical protein
MPESAIRSGFVPSGFFKSKARQYSLPVPGSPKFPASGATCCGARPSASATPMTE